MDSYKWLVHASRYLAKSLDTPAKFDPVTNNHIVVIRKNRFFVLPLAHPNGEELSYSEFEAYATLSIDM